MRGQIPGIVEQIMVNGEWVDSNILDPEFVEKKHDEAMRRAINALGGKLIEDGNC